MSEPDVQERRDLQAAATSHRGDRVFNRIITGAAFVALLVLAGITIFLGAQAVPVLQTQGLDFLTTSVWSPPDYGIWGMLYGSVANLAIVLALGRPFAFEASASYALSLVYLAVFGSILAFGSYLHLLERVGAARAGYTGVIIPIVALGVSSLFEGYRWSLLALAGVAVSVAGNILILRRPPARAA